jgi:multidrug resistance efflux pump
LTPAKEGDAGMVIIAILYLLIIWLVFFRLRLLPFNWSWGIASSIVGVGILAVFLALLNSLTPSGRVVVVGRVVEVTPNVAGQVTSIAVQPNMLVKAGAVLFEIDRTPFENKVKQLQAALAESRQKIERMKADVALSIAETAAVNAQLVPAKQRRDDLQRLALANTTSQFQLQDASKQVDLLSAQLEAATARAESVRLALDSAIDGEHTSVAQISAQLDDARWELEQTTVRAPSDGYVTAMALVVGYRAVPLRAVLSFIVADDAAIFGLFPQNGFARVKPGARVKLSLLSRPGRVYETTIVEVVRGLGEGQIAVSGNLTRGSQIGTTSDYVARIAPPPDLDPDFLRLGMVGTATVIAPDAGPIGLLAITCNGCRPMPCICGEADESIEE